MSVLVSPPAYNGHFQQYRWYVDSVPKLYLDKANNDALNNLNLSKINGRTKITIGKSKCYISRTKNMDTLTCCDEDGVNVTLQREMIWHQLNNNNNMNNTFNNNNNNNHNNNNYNSNTYTYNNYHSNNHYNYPNNNHNNYNSNNNNYYNHYNNHNNNYKNYNNYNSHNNHNSHSHNNNDNNNNNNNNSQPLIPNIGENLIYNPNGWNFQLDSKEWEACKDDLTLKLNKMDNNASINYKIGNWRYKITKIDCNLAEQYNIITQKRRYLCKTEYIQTFETNIKTLQDCNKKVAKIIKKQTKTQQEQKQKENKTQTLDSSKMSTLVYPSQHKNTKLMEYARLQFCDTMPTHKYRIVQITDLIDENLVPQSHIEMYKTALKMEKNSTEMYCFHGTHSVNVDKIIQNGFDRSFNKNSLYGKGVYLAKNASLSVGFCQKSNNYKIYKNNLCMFYCKAIINDCVIGQQDKTAHYKEDGKTQYTTLVDSLKNPKIYVITRDFYVIPLALIQFQHVNAGY